MLPSSVTVLLSVNGGAAAVAANVAWDDWGIRRCGIRQISELRNTARCRCFQDNTASDGVVIPDSAECAEAVDGGCADDLFGRQGVGVGDNEDEDEGCDEVLRLGAE